MIRILSFLVFTTYILAPFIAMFVVPVTIENNYLNISNINIYIYFFYGVSVSLYIATMLSIKYLFGGSVIGLILVFIIISFIPANLHTMRNSSYDLVVVYICWVLFHAFSYWLTGFPTKFLNHKKEKDFYEKLSPILFESFRQEITFKYGKEFEKLPKISWNDYTFLGFIFGQLINILNKRINRLKPEYNCTFQNTYYEELFEILTKRLRTQFPQSAHINLTIELRSKEGFKTGMIMSEEEFRKYLEFLSQNYTRHPDKIDRSNMIPDTVYNVEKGLKKAHGKIHETLDNLKGTTRLKKKIEELKSLKDEETIDEDEYLKLRKITLEKYVSQQTKETSVLKNKLKEIEQLMEDKFINQIEFDELKKIVLSKYA